MTATDTAREIAFIAADALTAGYLTERRSARRNAAAARTLADDAIRYTRPASLAPQTSVTAQDEILRVAATQAALSDPAAARLDRQGLRLLADNINYATQTLRLIHYGEGDEATLAIGTPVRVRGHNDAVITGAAPRYDGRTLYAVTDRYRVTRQMLRTDLTVI